MYLDTQGVQDYPSESVLWREPHFRTIIYTPMKCTPEYAVYPHQSVHEPQEIMDELARQIKCRLLVLYESNPGYTELQLAFPAQLMPTRLDKLPD